MPRPDSSRCFSGFDSGLGLGKQPRRDKPQQLACDRCRGQKLRCIRSSNPKAPCERCQKAGATCIIDSSVRMGRPRRTSDKNRQSSGSTSQPTSSQVTTSADFTPNSDAWLVHDLDDTPVDATLRSVTVQYLDAFDFGLHEEAHTCIQDESAGMSTERHLDATLDLSSGQSVPALTEDEGATMDTTCTEPLNDYSRFPPMRQETMQELSDLNMQLCRQLGAAGSAADKYTNMTAVATLRDENRNLCDDVVFMMHSLQTYHRLLVEMLGSGSTGMHDLNDNATNNSLLSPNQGFDGQEPRRHMSEGKRLASDGSVDFTLSPSANLDMPTSLLLLSCHTNLIYICRDAFAAIRAALLTTHRQISLFTISFLNMEDLSIPPDLDLQVIVLIQAVVRMIDRIGRLLGYPDDYESDSGGETGESNARSSAIPQRLLDLMLRSEASGESPTDRAGTKALRDEIRGLHELVYRPV